MKSFIKTRLNKKMFFIALIISIMLAFLQIIQNLSPYFLENQFFDSPYTKWLSVDPFNFSPVIFFIVLPLISSIPAAILLKEDIDSGFIFQIIVRYNLKTTLKWYIRINFILGFITIFIPLLLNLFIYFLLLPNLVPDNLLNSNLLINQENTIFVALYYSHPFFHAILSILFASFFGGVFASFTTINALIIKNKFTVLASGLFLEIFLLVLNTFITLPNNVSFVPSDFLKESANNNISLSVSIFMTLILIFYIILIYKYRRNKIVW